MNDGFGFFIVFSHQKVPQETPAAFTGFCGFIGLSCAGTIPCPGSAACTAPARGAMPLAALLAGSIPGLCAVVGAPVGAVFAVGTVAIVRAILRIHTHACACTAAVTVAPAMAPGKYCHG